MVESSELPGPLLIKSLELKKERNTYKEKT